jgi:hypothetical protein
MKNERIVDRTELWKLATIIATLIGIIAVGVFAFQQRTPIIQSLTSKKIFLRNEDTAPPSSKSAEQLQEFMDKHDRIVAIDVVRVNFEKNERQTTWESTKMPEIESTWRVTEGVKFPMFTDNTVANGRIVSMINGQFVCTQTKETLSGRLHPIITQFSPTACTVPIPPGYGDFVGWINIYLNEQPTFAQLKTLEQLAEKVARDIYERDILKNSFKRQGMQNPSAVLRTSQ